MNFCPICGSDDLEVKSTLTESRREHVVVKCNGDCGSFWEVTTVDGGNGPDEMRIVLLTPEEAEEALKAEEVPDGT